MFRESISRRLIVCWKQVSFLVNRNDRQVSLEAFSSSLISTGNAYRRLMIILGGVFLILRYSFDGNRFTDFVWLLLDRCFSSSSRRIDPRQLNKDLSYRFVPRLDRFITVFAGWNVYKNAAATVFGKHLRWNQTKRLFCFLPEMRQTFVWKLRRRRFFHEICYVPKNGCENPWLKYSHRDIKRRYKRKRDSSDFKILGSQLYRQVSELRTVLKLLSRLIVCYISHVSWVRAKSNLVRFNDILPKSTYFNFEKRSTLGVFELVYKNLLLRLLETPNSL